MLLVGSKTARLGTVPIGNLGHQVPPTEGTPTLDYRLDGCAVSAPPPHGQRKSALVPNIAKSVAAIAS
ncbi:hypothetical protein AURDEDRAFT_176448 [Auricularia subglabra TFB-10046 SS5]|uniref:Uncharacterized protein n=1 Tax=Auricularia subglabra (strain TFB-10046 / SS5) TaxID=717982 RepID=J0CVQ7_AURST|nr:hypothetical protein AURDEDRAFT_176448 [Auricularia subglabra TFB-10046 SS5]